MLPAQQGRAAVFRHDVDSGVALPPRRADRADRDHRHRTGLVGQGHRGSVLDVSVQAQIINLLQDLQEEFDLTYLFVAHDLSVVRHLCDHVAVMQNGKLVEFNETEKLFEEPRGPYTIKLLSAIPSPDPDERLEFPEISAVS